MKRISLIFIAFLMVLQVCGCSGPAPTATEYTDGEIDTSGDPIQTPYSSEEIFTVEDEDARFTLTPIARYSISARVLGKKTYPFDEWRTVVAPLDLALSWGQVAEPDYYEQVKWSQHDRFYFYRWGRSASVNGAVIAQHSANNHIIPANDNVKRAVKSIKEEQKVTLEGFLVKVRGTYEGREYYWNSSVKRTDTGAGACEVFYVTKVIAGNEVYQ